MKAFLKNTVILFISCYSTSLLAQINPLDVQYFQNRYLANPAMAGLEQGLHLNLAYRNQWSNMPGAPKNQNVTLESGNDKVGIGLNLNNDKSGLIDYTKIVGTYAYHLPLNRKDEVLHMGVSLGYYRGSLNIQNVIGDPNDPDLVNFNERETAIDGDFGITYSRENFDVEAAFYNIKSQVKKDIRNTADRHLSYFAVQYVFPIQDWTIKSKLAYRGIKNYTDIADVGLNAITPDEKLLFTLIYHTNKSTSFGLSYLHLKRWQILGVYNTAAQQINQYANGSFEIGLRVNLNKKSNIE